MSTATGALPHKQQQRGGLHSAISTASAERVSSVRLPEDVLFTQPVVLGGLQVVVVASARAVRAVVLTDGGTTLMSPHGREVEEDRHDGFASPVASMTDLGGGVSSIHALPLIQQGGRAQTASAAVFRALIAVGTTHGAIRVLCLEATAAVAAPVRLGFRTIATVALSDISAHQISSTDTVVSVAWISPPASSSSWFPEGLVVATRKCVLGLSLGGLEALVVTAQISSQQQQQQSSSSSSTTGFVPRRAHCSIHNDATSVVRVVTLPPTTDARGGPSAQFRAGNTTATSSSSLNSVADHCLACVIVHDNGAVRYLVRHLADNNNNNTTVTSNSTSKGSLAFSYRLCSPTCAVMADLIAATSSANHSHIIVNDAVFEYDEVSNALHLVLCGVEMSDPSSYSSPIVTNTLHKGATPTTATSSSVYGSLRAQASVTSSFFAAPSGSQYAFASQSPYAHKIAWWGVIRGAVPLADITATATGASLSSNSHHNSSSVLLTTTPQHFTLPMLMQSRDYVSLLDTVVGSWCASTVAKSAPPPQRQSSATPIDRRGFATCSALLNHTTLLTMGCELHIGSNNSTSSSSSSSPSSVVEPSAPQLMYTFATAISSCTTMLGGVMVAPSTNNGSGALQRIVVGSGIFFFFQSSATPIDRRGFASCSALLNHTTLLTMGCELHIGGNNSSSSSSPSSVEPSAPQLMYTFATAISSCTTMLSGVIVAPSTINGSGALQRIVVGSGNSLHLLLLTVSR
ncbi:Hypothetical protein, putative [Bodo saltans]|uniref:Uncharacterized protein n=1 Tax=Bodo saltans TaxID=75058 RepID=A0A0S4KHC2_BODSA|nr:Hypothetical protein, putative [Bodo saltans]|eukprot:CUI15093.1 Hypothetical protein, putative [Bodo saltans]